jgi:glucose/arabinose dehydrogenase
MRSFTRVLTRTLLLLAVGGAAIEAAAQSPFTADPSHGKMLFQQSCSLCHTTGQEKRLAAGQGPVLAGVVGRRAATVPDFGYTEALRASKLTWDAGTLDRFLAGPGELVPGTNMVVTVANPADRRDLIAFLATLHPSGAPVGAGKAAAAVRVSGPGDWQNDTPGMLHRIKLEDLPAPYATPSAGNGPTTVDRPPGAALSVPAGFQVKLFASRLSGPRLLRAAPNGDIFIAETGAGRICVLRAADGADAPSADEVFASGLKGPFGIAFYPLDGDPRWVYVGTLNSVVRFAYRNGDLHARGPAEIVVARLAGTTGGHTTRDVVFSLDGRRMFISVGSGSNVAEEMPAKSPEEIRDWAAEHALGSAWGAEADRADILETDPEGREHLQIFATGIRNAVGLAVQPGTGELWASTNERDALGDDLVPDYITRVRRGAYYGWPWYYLGDHEDPRHAGERPDLAGRATVPDVLLQAHSASLEMTFYPQNASGLSAFPDEYRGDAFAALHGSWNRTGRTGSKVIRVRLHDGVPAGGYEDFMTGFVVDDGHVWGRPVGVTVARDGALLVTDDANGTLWRISYLGR